MLSPADKLAYRSILLQIILIFSHGVILGSCEEIKVSISIDTSPELDDVGNKGECTYYFSLEGNTCKKPHTYSTVYVGYWTSCALRNCDLTVRVGDIGGLGRVPSRMDVLCYIKGSSSEIQPRYKLTSGGLARDFGEPVTETNGWTTRVIPIESSLGLTPDSELILRLTSTELEDEVDLVDKITFIFSDTTTSTTPSTTTTTQNPGLPDESLDHGNPLPAGWSTNCKYELNHENYDTSLCPMKVPGGDSESRIGFWSSCGKYCALTYSPAAVQKPPPTSIVINSFVSGHATLDIWVRINHGVLKLVGTVNDTTWTNATFSLMEFGLDADSEILFEPSSTRYPHHVDLIDTITIRFQ